MEAKGWTRVECLEFWETLLDGATHSAMVHAGEDPLGQEARQLASPGMDVPAPMRAHQP